MGEITRRAALKAAPAVALTAAVPAIGGESESELILALRQWRADYRALSDQRPPDMSDDDYGVLVDLSTDRLDALLAIPAETPQEVAMKVVMYDLDHDIRERSAVLEQELYRLARLDGRASTLGVFPTAPPESEIMRLFREWQHLQANDPPEVADRAADDEIMGEHVQRIWRVAEEMAAVPSTSARDVAAKLIAGSENGMLLDPSVPLALIDEARRLVGLTT